MSTTGTIRELFHEGELAVQRRAGARAQGQNSGRMISDAIIPGAIKFVGKQPFLVAASVDAEQNVWASIVVGRTGFMVAEPRTLDLDLAQSHRIDADPLRYNLAGDPRVGILVIDLRSRARLRINGRASFPSANRLHVDVEQSYPNCPKYIQRRTYRPAMDDVATYPSSLNSSDLNHKQQQWIAHADTLFVASEHTTGLDASHRGGQPGFIQVVDSTRLRIPDYPGNGMFNTLGNLATNTRAGLVIPDFDGARTLHLTGRAEVSWNVDDPRNETGGTGRYWDFDIERCVQIDNSLPGSAEFFDYSPHNPSIST